MAYRLSIAEDVPSSVRACAREQLAGAAAQLEDAERDPVAAVHEARKSIKKTRALLRLVRPALGRKAYRAEDRALRNAGLALSGARDADVLAQTAGRLAEHACGRVPADALDALDALRDALAAEAARARAGAGAGGAAGSERAAAIEALRAAELRVEAWPIGAADWETVLAGVARAYARGRDAFRIARATPEPEPLHAWRKRAKDLWYHQRLLTPAWPGMLAAQAQEAHELTELLGEAHDLAVLAARLTDEQRPLDAPVEAARAQLLALIALRSDELRAAAVRLGRRVYAESPKAFSRRLARYVRIAVAERRAGTGPPG